MGRPKDILNVLLISTSAHNLDRIMPDVAVALRRAHHRTRLVSDTQPALKHRLWSLGRATAAVGLHAVGLFKPSWATVWAQSSYDKAEECRILEAAGIRVPRWTVMGDEPVDLTGFPPVVVVKPVLGLRGALVRVMRRERVRPRRLELTSSSVEQRGMIIQEYVHTGPWPTSFRVATVFGEPVYALRMVADTARATISGDVNRPEAFAGRTIVASSKGCRMSTDVPEDVIAFGRRVHEAFPDIPLLGSDIIRDAATGELYALEVNSQGWTLHLANDVYERLRRESGIDLRRQFGGVDAVARGILTRLRTLADGRPNGIS
jgi:hypothetical protein